MPVLLSWCAKETLTEAVNLASLIDMNDNGEVVLTPACERALRVVFDTIDLDKNGLLSQLEFDLFIQHTSGETAADEWFTIEGIELTLSVKYLFISPIDVKMNNNI